MNKKEEVKVFYVTLKKKSGIPAFGEINYCRESDFSLPILFPSLLGEIILEEIQQFHSSDNTVEILHYYLMPDCIHLLVAIDVEKLDLLNSSLKNFIDKLNQDVRIGGLPNVKGNILEDYYECKNVPNENAFNKTSGYDRTKQIIYAILQDDPDIFTKISWINIQGTVCQLYGDVTFLFNPFKYFVSISNDISASKKESLFQELLQVANNGGVLVGHFVSTVEKELLEKIWNTSARIILINPTPLKDGQMPSKHLLKRYRDRNLLIMSPCLPANISKWELSTQQNQLYRDYFKDFIETVARL